MLESALARSQNVKFWKRLGRVKLGKKTFTSKIWCKQQHAHVEACHTSYPVDVKHFILDPKWHGILGAEPQSLDIMLAFPTLIQNFDTNRKNYKQNGSRFCYSDDGVTAMRLQELPMAPDPKTGEMKRSWGYRPMPCPGAECEYAKKGACPERGFFEFMIPSTNEVGTFTMRTGSVVAVNQMLATLRALEGFTARRPNGLHGLHMTLRREEVTFHKDVNGDGTMTKIVKFIPKLEINFAALMAEDRRLLGPLVGQQLALPAPEVLEREEAPGSGVDDEEFEFDGRLPGQPASGGRS